MRKHPREANIIYSASVSDSYESQVSQNTDPEPLTLLPQSPLQTEAVEPYYQTI